MLPAKTAMVGNTLGHHEILGKLGEARMGAIYLARDTKLRRNVRSRCCPPSSTVPRTVNVNASRQETREVAALNYSSVRTAGNAYLSDSSSAIERC